MNDMHYLIRRIAENIQFGRIADMANHEPLHEFLWRRPGFAVWLGDALLQELMPRPESFWSSLWSS